MPNVLLALFPGLGSLLGSSCKAQGGGGTEADCYPMILVSLPVGFMAPAFLPTPKLWFAPEQPRCVRGDDTEQKCAMYTVQCTHAAR